MNRIKISVEIKMLLQELKYGVDTTILAFILHVIEYSRFFPIASISL